MHIRLSNLATMRLNKDLSKCSNEEIYLLCLELAKTEISKKEKNTGKRKLYYFSAEFLIGKLLSNNLINLGLYESVKEELASIGRPISEIEELENEPSLGNGGLGRLAACFLDSIATLGLPGDGIGLNYHFGLFKQHYENLKQTEQKNAWIDNQSWLEDTGFECKVSFKDLDVQAKLYDISVTGYDSGVNKLHLFDIKTIDESLATSASTFDKTAIEKNLTLFLYPDDSDRAGHLLRIYQQYFMVSAGVSYIFDSEKKQGHKIEDLDKHVVIQINDTHPTMVIPELIRRLELEGISFEEAMRIVSNTCAYTNHTILAEALEKWPVEYLEETVPQLMPIIHKLDTLVKEKYANEKVHIIDASQRVHMANIDIHFSYSTNGVAKLHTDILMQEELNDFYQIYPERFNNKTNGITFRRWLQYTNQPLTKYLVDKIGTGFYKDALELEKLLAYASDSVTQEEIIAIKQRAKNHLADYISEKENIELHRDGIFDIQIKRLHEYKRQQMNALYVIYKYLEIKKGNIPARPINIIFGGKAAPAYIIAKDIIHLLLSLSKLIENDPEVSKHLKLVMVENYNVSYAEKLIPACDVSEQISLASKEASGTGNMKFMLNGAVTLGTLDGANVEISELVGEDNIYIFGKSSEEVIDLYAKSAYKSSVYYEKDEIKRLVDFIVSDELMSIGCSESLNRLHNELIVKDWFMTLLDIEDYIATKERIFKDYEDRSNWGRMMLTNIAKAGFFSSDRTIAQYNNDIWKLK